MGVKVASQFNMCMRYIWVGVYNIVFEWNGDFIYVVNVVMDQCITYEVSLKVKYSCRWMYLWRIDKFDKYQSQGVLPIQVFEGVQNETREEWFILLWYIGEALS